MVRSCRDGNLSVMWYFNGSKHRHVLIFCICGPALSCHHVSQSFRSWWDRLTLWSIIRSSSGRLRFRPWSSNWKVEKRSCWLPGISLNGGTWRYSTRPSLQLYCTGFDADTPVRVIEELGWHFFFIFTRESNGNTFAVIHLEYTLLLFYTTFLKYHYCHDAWS